MRRTRLCGFTGAEAGVTPRRFPPPWTVDESDTCFIVRDKNGQALAHIYFM